MMLFILGTFYATMVLAGYIVEFAFSGLGLVPTSRRAKVGEIAINWDYTSVLNIVFLVVAAGLCYRFVRTGGTPMLKMMGGQPEPAGASGEHQVHVHG